MATTGARSQVLNNSHKYDRSRHFEFGGSPGALAIILFSPPLMYYMWIGAVYYEGHAPMPADGESWGGFVSHLVMLAYTGAFPTAKAWMLYWSFLVLEALGYLYLPGIECKGRPLEHLGGQQLRYRCTAVAALYSTIVAVVLLHITGMLKMYVIMDEFGPIMSVAIISGFLVSFVAYFSAKARGAEHRMKGYPIYDFFMGLELNPRMFGILDFKMFFEVRLPWYMLLLMTMSAAAWQYENYGYVSGEMCFLLMAHYLYANACSKGEELITPTWSASLLSISW